MACHHVKVGLVDGQPVAAIVCTDRPRRRKCKHCDTLTTDHRLCDWKIGDGKTCDSPLCASCTNIPQQGKDLCKAHWDEWQLRTRKTPVPISEKVEYVKKQGQTRNHHCHWPGCDRQVPPAVWGCRPHWYTLPKELRNRIWQAYRPGQEIDQKPSETYVTVAREVQAWIERYLERGKTS
jgi:hypothetical protein